MARTKTSARRSAARKPVTKSRAKPVRAAAKRATAVSPKKRSQFFRVSHHSEDDFETGLRAYAKYRDLGMAKATAGLVQAHVIRFVPPCRPEEVSKPPAKIEAAYHKADDAIQNLIDLLAA